MAQQGRNNNTYGFDELAFWRPIDAENRPVYRAVLRESRAIQDEAQDILNRFAGLSMMGLLPKAQVERLHRDIARWKKQGESTGELRLLMQDAQRRTRMRCDEAMLLYLMHAISDSYARISETDRGALLSASRIAYKRAFAEGNEITRLGAKSVPGAKFVRDTLSNNPLPTGLTYEQALAADAAYRAREITKQAVVDSSQGKELSMDSEPMQAILRLIGMMIIYLLVHLLTGYFDLLSIDNDNVVTAVDVGSEDRLILASQHFSNLRCQTA